MYQIGFLPKAINSLESLDSIITTRIISKIEWLTENIEMIRLIPLTGQFSGLYKLKIGDYRVIYDVDHDKKTVTVLKIGHRREIYR